MNRFLLVFVLVLTELGLGCALAAASSFTPLEWQQVVKKHSIPGMVGQRKHTTWVRDQNRNFIDDEIERRFRPGEAVNVIVDLNQCLPADNIQKLFSGFGQIKYIGKLITFVVLDNVLFDELPRLAALPEVAMIEWQEPLYALNDVSNRAVQARSSVTYAGKAAEDMGFTGTGVNIAIVDSGLDDTHEAFTAKFVAGFNALNPADPGDGSTHPPDDTTHGTHVAGIALAKETPGRVCRTPDDGSLTNCGGMAPTAGVVAIKVCDNTGFNSTAIMKGFDWLGMNAAKFKIRVANISIGGCGNDDGTSVLSQQVNYLVAIGIAVAVSANNCSPPGSQVVGVIASSSFAMTTTGTDDRGTVSRTDDTIWSGFDTGPRMDFNLVSPNLLALKPDIAAPATTIFSALAGSLNKYVGYTGTSMASPHVAGGAADIIQAHPDIDPGSLKDRLLRSADTSHNIATFPSVDTHWDKAFGHGILNVGAALAAGTTDVGFPSCVGPPASPGAPCALTPPTPPWENTTDITTASPPQVGVANTITAQVKNFGGVSATVLVNFGVYELAVGNNEFYHIGTVQVTVGAGATVGVPQSWTPDAVNHQCIQVSIQFGLDTNFGNNVTQRNFTVAPSVYRVRVENPFMVPARFQVKLKSQREGWRCRVEQDTFTLDPFKECPRELLVTFDAPYGARPGDRANCQIGVYATPEGGKTQLIGGVTVQTFVPKPCRMNGTVLDAQGNPVSGARLVFSRRIEATGTSAPPSAKSAVPTQPATTALTNQDGIFSVQLPPDLVENVVVEKAGLGKGETYLRPSCGPCSMKFVLSEYGVKSVETCSASRR